MALENKINKSLRSVGLWYSILAFPTSGETRMLYRLNNGYYQLSKVHIYFVGNPLGWHGQFVAEQQESIETKIQLIILIFNYHSSKNLYAWWWVILKNSI